MKIVYTAEALATGEGRDGHGRTSDGRLDLDLAFPKEMGGTATAPTPSSCSPSGTRPASTPRYRLVGRQAKADVADSAVGARVSLGPIDNGGFGLAVSSRCPCPTCDPRRARN